MKFGQFALLGAALLLSTRLFAAEGLIPVAVAESESFEVVARLQDEGLVFYIDRSDSNAPVLGAVLEVESAGKSAKATFRAERAITWWPMPNGSSPCASPANTRSA